MESGRKDVEAYSGVGAYYNIWYSDTPSESPLTWSIGYFQPFGSVVNVGNTEWIKYVATDPAGVGQVTYNIVQALSGNRTFIGAAPFSRTFGFDIGYSTQLQLAGEQSTSCVMGFWALDASQQTATVERGKWLSYRQTASGYSVKAFGRNAAGASRVYYQNGAGEIAVWDVSMTTAQSTTLRPLVDASALCFATSWTLIGAGLISGVTELDLVLASSTQIMVQMMNGAGGTIGNVPGNSTTMNMPAGATVAAFGSVPVNGVATPAIAFLAGTQLTVAIITMTGLVEAIVTTISGLASSMQLGGFADLNDDGHPEFLVSSDGFTLGVTSGAQSGVPLNVAASALSPLSMKSGYEQDPPPYGSLPAYEVGTCFAS